MRNNLTPAFLVEMAKDANTPIQLMVIKFINPKIDNIYLSDRDIVVDGQLYEGLIEEWGDLITVAAENAISSTMTTTVTIWDGSAPKISSFFLLEDPMNMFVDLYQTFDGLQPEGVAHLVEFVIPHVRVNMGGG